MEKKDLIKVENAAIRAAGSRMAKMFQPMGEHEGDKEARRAFYEGFQEGAAYYRLLISRIDDEFANLIDGAHLDSGPEEDTHSVMEMCLKNGIPVITAVQKAPGKKETEKLREDVKNFIATVPLDMSPDEAKKFSEEHTAGSEPEEPKKDEPSVSETMEDCIKATPEQCRACDSHEDCPRSCANIEKIREQHKMFAKKLEFPIEQAKAKSEKKAEEPKDEEAQIDPEGFPLWKRPMDRIIKVLEKLDVKFTRKGDEHIFYLHFEKDSKEYTIYFEQLEEGTYKVVFSDKDAHGGQVLWNDVINNSRMLLELGSKLTSIVKG